MTQKPPTERGYRTLEELQEITGRSRPNLNHLIRTYERTTGDKVHRVQGRRSKVPHLTPEQFQFIATMIDRFDKEDRTFDFIIKDMLGREPEASEPPLPDTLVELRALRLELNELREALRKLPGELEAHLRGMFGLGDSTEEEHT